VVKLAAVRPKYIVVGAMFIIVLEKVCRFRHPLHQLPPLKLVQLMADVTGVPWVCCEQEKNVVQQGVGYENANDDHYQKRHEPMYLQCATPIDLA
jgi:hypothetical protein